MKPRRNLRRSAASVLAALMLAVSACSSDGDEPRADTSGPEGETTTSSVRGQAPPVEHFDGSVDDFYVVPDPLPPGEPGDLIRTQPIEAGEGEVGLRIMYHSTDVNGADRAVTGVLVHPTAEPPEGGWPVLAYAHGTTGIASQCAPSRVPSIPGDFGVEGVRVATDYIGLGPVGEVHSYLSATAEGNAVADSVIAAHNVAGANAGDDLLVYGHSQGGHAALITNEIAAERIPQYRLLGTVAIAPGAQFTEDYGDHIQTRIITTMVMFGGVDEIAGFDPADYLNPDVHETAQKVVHEKCLGDIIDALLPLAARDDYYLVEPNESGVARQFMQDNDPATVVSESPLLLVNGLRDVIVVPQRTRGLFDRLCSIGQVVEYVELPDADHGTEPRDADPHVRRWFADRLAGAEAPNSCEEG